MTGTNRDETQVLARARRALSPTAADQERVARSLEMALAAPHGPPVVSRLLTTCAVAALAAGAGYWAGHRAGVRQAQTGVATAARQTPSRGAAADGVTVPSLVVPASAPRAILPSITAVVPPPPAAPGPTPSARHARLSRNVVAAQDPALSPAESLNEEVRVLRTVERALRDRQPGLALALLRELDRTIPGGKLMEERAATSTIARCTSGAVPLDVDLAEDFADRFPDSVYFSRVRQSCR